MSLFGNNVCEKCNVRVPKNRPKLICSECRHFKHYRCQKLTKAEALEIIGGTGVKWTCYECIVSALPLNACAVSRVRDVPAAVRTKVKCGCCSGYSYRLHNVVTCPWCDQLCHKKCVNNSLGCTSCCNDIIPGFHVHNYELLGNINHVNNAIFNPYSHSSNVNLIGDKIANEEENNSVWNDISESLINCNYKKPNNVVFPKNTELNVLSLNIRSLHRNLAVIADNIKDYQKYDVVCFNETNCNFDNLANGIDDLEIEGFHPPIFQAPARSTCRGGGLATYINKRLCTVDDIELLCNIPEPSPDGEFLFLKIKQCKNVNKTVIIGNVYRSPSRKPNKFNELFGSVLQKLGRHNKKHIIIVGDFNVDLIKYEHDINAQDLIELATNHGYTQVISRPTRVTDHSATLIDHIYTNKINNMVNSSVVTVDLSDHLATLVTISLDGSYDNMQRPTNRRNDTEQCEYRLFNEANDEKFRQLISEENWESLDGLEAQSQYDAFVAIYSKHYDSAYPVNSKRIRRKNERIKPKPWIFPWMEEACARKNRLYHTFIKNPTIINKVKYNKMKKIVDKHIKLAKNKYYKKYFEQYSDNSKKQWQLINSLLNRNKKKCGIPNLQDGSGNVINTPLAVAEKFNDYFSNIASNLKAEINCGPINTPYDCQHLRTQSAPVPNSMYVRPVEGGEIFDIIKNLKNKATLDTKISALKLASLDIKFIQTLARVVTTSFEQGIFPQSLKLARVVPVHKGGSKSEVSNYRPISLLTSFSKIYEKIMHNRIVDFMNSNNSLYEMQYGFRAGRSCEHAVLKAQSILLESLNKNQISLLLLIDFSKAFDMVEHSILLKKLHHYGIRGTALSWLKSYLENREQFVSVGGKNSSKTRITYGVPQGSILGPLLFVIYINDIPGIADFAKFILYADDANIIITGHNIVEIEEQLSRLSAALLKWVNENGLKLNLRKTNYMIFSRQNMRDNLNVMLGNTPIERKSEARFLGILIDDRLNWSKHIRTVKMKMSRYVGVMYKIKSQLPLQARLQIYHSFVQSHINFCSLVWGFAAKSNIESLFSSQKKGIRAVMPGFVNSFFKDGVLPTHTKTSFNKFKVLTVHNVIAKNALIFMHKINHFPNLLPSSVNETIAPDAPVSGSCHETCHNWLSNFGTRVYNKSIFFKGPLLYVDPSAEQLLTPHALISINYFKSNTKRMLINTQITGNSDEWQSDNFLLFSINGLRRSSRLNI